MDKSTRTTALLIDVKTGIVSVRKETYLTDGIEEHIIDTSMNGYMPIERRKQALMDALIDVPDYKTMLDAKWTPQYMAEREAVLEPESVNSEQPVNP